MGNKENTENIESQNIKKSPKLAGRVGQIAFLLLSILPITGNTLPSKQSEKKVQSFGQVDIPNNTHTMHIHESDESVEVDEELLFKAAISQAVRPIHSLKDIPAGGIQLKYPQAYTGNLPRSIDFFPKEIKAETLPYTIIKIGKKMFVVSPDLGFVVDKMYLDKDNFYVHVVEKVWGVTVVGKEIAKSKESELGTYLAKLYFKGEKASYTLSTVHEVPEAYQAQALKNLEKINVQKKD